MIAFDLFAMLLIVSIATGVPVLFAVIMGMFVFASVGLHRGFSLKAMAELILHGMERALVVLRVFILIGVLTALWRASGTVPLLVYYSIQAIPAHLFVVFSFLITAVVSYMLGTAFGTVGTIGVVLMVMAHSGGVFLPLAAGAIISGAYYGDRAAPTSSCANLVAAITHTSLYGNVRAMLKNSMAPLLLSAILYGVLSLRNPLQRVDEAMLEEISASFGTGLVALLPALLILILPLFKIGVGKAMLASIGAAALIARFVQGMGWAAILQTALHGYVMEGTGRFAAIIGGGGLLSMLNVALLVLFSSSYSGIFSGTGMLDGVEHRLEVLAQKIGLYPVTLITATVGSMVACNQTLAVMMTQQVLRPIYARNGRTDEELAMGVANTAVVLPALVPWSVACTLPLSTLGVGFSALPFALFPILVPLWALAYDRFCDMRLKRGTAMPKKTEMPQ